jgi:hypothetical protein
MRIMTPTSKKNLAMFSKEDMTEALHTSNSESSLDSESGNDDGEIDDRAVICTVIDDDGDQEEGRILNLFYGYDKL